MGFFPSFFLCKYRKLKVHGCFFILFCWIIWISFSFWITCHNTVLGRQYSIVQDCSFSLMLLKAPTLSGARLCKWAAVGWIAYGAGVAVTTLLLWTDEKTHIAPIHPQNIIFLSKHGFKMPQVWQDGLLRWVSPLILLSGSGNWLNFSHTSQNIDSWIDFIIFFPVSFPR